MADIQRLDSRDADFRQRLDALLAWESVSDEAVLNTVQSIIAEVRARGDAALVELSNRFDRRNASHMAELELPPQALQQALDGLPAEQREALQQAADRVRAYAERQKLESWSFEEPDGTLLGQQVSPLDRAGLYVPGGKAAYPSSVLMNALPAKVAGVPELVMVVPMPDGAVNQLVLAAARVAGVDRVFTIGGAQAVAALAYGTESVPAVDKIVGPGNIFVATAKRLVFGTVGIDMIAGPSEICVISDGGTDADWIATDLFSQAEHDEDAQPILLAWDDAHIAAVAASIDRLLPQQPRREVIAASLRARGALIRVRDLDQAIEICNHIAPEHLELSIERAREVAGRIRHAGAIFMGRYTAEALGDYCAGPNHVLPTSRSARFSSPLGVYDFQKRSSLIDCSAQAASELGKVASVLARGEGLIAHANSAEYRIIKD